MPIAHGWLSPVLLALVLVPGAAFALPPAGGADEAAVHGSLEEALRTGAPVRITIGERRIELEDPRLESLAIVSRPSSGETARFFLRDIEAVEVRHRASKRPALIGVVVGAGIGLALGVLANQADQDEPRQRNVGAFALGGATLGMLAGSLISLPFNRWQPVHP